MNMIPTINTPIALIFSFPGMFMILANEGMNRAPIPRSTRRIPTPNKSAIMVSPSLLPCMHLNILLKERLFSYFFLCYFFRKRKKGTKESRVHSNTPTPRLFALEITTGRGGELWAPHCDSRSSTTRLQICGFLANLF